MDANGLVTGISVGTTTVTYTNSNGCSVTQIITISALPVATITGDFSLCENNTTQLTGSGTAATTLPWTSSDTSIATVSSTGLVTGINTGNTSITYTDNNGANATVTITVNELPTILGNTPVCVSQNIILTGSGNASSIIPWTSSNDSVATVDSNGTVTALNAGTTSITYTNSNGCSTSVNLSVEAQPALTSISLYEPYLCMGSIDFYTVDFSENNGNGTFGSLYEWTVLEPEFEGIITYDTTSSNNITIDWGNTPIGTYTVQITETNASNCSVSQSSTITIEQAPMIDLEDIYICLDENNQWLNSPILETNLNSNVYSFQWYLNNVPLPETDNFLIPTETGTYKVEVISMTSNCDGIFSCEISTSTPITATVETLSDFSNNQQIIVNATGGIPPYLYSLDNINYQTYNTFNIDNVGAYNVYVKDQTECNLAEETICIFTYPNFFSPNQDGVNDYWNINMPNDIYLSDISIFDRHGKLIYKNNNLADGWDGTLNARPLPNSDYWFKIEYVDCKGESKVFRSHFSLVR